MDPDRRYEISGSETNDSLLFSAIAAARVSPFVLVLLSPSWVQEIKIQNVTQEET